MPTVFNRPLRPVVSPIDWNNPITKGLVFDWKQNSRGYNHPRNNVNGNKATISATPSETLRRFGSGIDFGTTAHYIWENQANLSNFSHMTIEVIYIRDGGGSNGYGTLFTHGDQSTEVAWIALKNDNGDSGWGFRVETMYTDREKVWSSAYPSNGVVHHDIIVYDHTNKNNTPLWWRDGAPLSLTNRFDSAWTRTINANDIKIGRSLWTGGTEVWDGPVFLSRYWNRMLSVKQVHQLFADPNVIYRSNPVFGKATAAAPSTSIKDMISMGFIPFAR